MVNQSKAAQDTAVRIEKHVESRSLQMAWRDFSYPG